MIFAHSYDKSMATIKGPKFDLGKKVKVKGNSDFDGGEVVSVSYINGEWVYKFASKEVDHVKKEVIDGFKTVTESELEEVKSK